MSPDELAELIDALADEHPEVANEAAASLLERPDLSRRPLVELVRAGGADQRTRHAVRLLGHLGNREDVQLLADLIQRPRSGLAWDAALALTLHPSELATVALMEATRTEAPETVEAAASALGERGDEDGRPALETLLVHGSEAVRYRAVYALGRLGSMPSNAALREAVEREPSADVRALMVDLLESSVQPDA